MNAFLLLVPLLLLGYGILGMISKEALKRASFFAPLQGKEKIAYWVYQFTTACIFIYLLFLRIKVYSVWFFIGLVVFILGTVLYTVSIVNYAMPKTNGINVDGLYRLSRNPRKKHFCCCLFFGLAAVVLDEATVFIHQRLDGVGCIVGISRRILQPSVCDAVGVDLLANRERPQIILSLEQDRLVL